MNKIAIYIFLIIVGIMLGYAWAYNAYMPTIHDLTNRLDECNKIINYIN